MQRASIFGTAGGTDQWRTASQHTTFSAMFVPRHKKYELLGARHNNQHIATLWTRALASGLESESGALAPPETHWDSL